MYDQTMITEAPTSSREKECTLCYGLKFDASGAICECVLEEELTLRKRHGALRAWFGAIRNTA